MISKKVIFWAALVGLPFFISCNKQEAKLPGTVEATLKYKLHKKEAIVEIEFEKTLTWIIRPQFYHDTLTNITYFFLISQKVQPCIKRYKIISNNKLELLDSVALPESMVREGHVDVETFLPLAKDSFLIMSGYSEREENYFALQNMQGESKMYTLPSHINENKVSWDYGQYTNRDPIFQHSFVSRFYTHPRYGSKQLVASFDFRDTSKIELLFNDDKGFSKLNPKVFICRVNDWLVMANSGDLALRLENLKTKEKRTIDLQFRGFNKPFYDNKENLYEQNHFESNFIKGVWFNPYRQEIWVEIHHAGDYYYEDGLKKRYFTDANTSLFIFDIKFKFKGRLLLEGQERLGLFHSYLSKNGFFVRKFNDGENDNLVYAEYIEYEILEITD